MKLKFLFVPALLAGLFFVFTQSCAKYEAEKPAVIAPAPAANGASLWRHITEVAPYKQYQFWPGKTALYIKVQCPTGPS